MIENFEPKTTEQHVLDFSKIVEDLALQVATLVQEWLALKRYVKDEVVPRLHIMVNGEAVPLNEYLSTKKKNFRNIL